jgi:hypothetical protein
VTYGTLKAVAVTWQGELLLFRFLIRINEADWQYIYVPCTNYRFRADDPISWDLTNLYWHAKTRTVQFPLIYVGMKV